MPVIQPHFGYLAVRFNPGVRPADKRAIAIQCHLEPYCSRHDLPDEAYALVPVAAGARSDQVRHARAAAALARHRRVVRAGRVFRHRKSLVVATDRIWVGLAAGRVGQAVMAKIRHRGGRLVRRHDGDHLIRLPAAVDPVRECARLTRLVAVEYAEPDQVIVGRGFTGGAGRKPGGRVQPALTAVGAPQAWRLQSIDRSTVVAVLDCGVDSTHPDLRGAVTRSSNPTGHGSALRPAPWDSHGTECAGLVAAIGRPGGLRGIAAGCGLYSVRVGYTPTRLAAYVSKVSWFVAGVEWAWRNGADVLSMSFGGGPRATPVERALTRARTLGRGGHGCVLVAAVGNSGIAGVEFPASAAGVIGVAATDGRGRPASFSNRGAGVDLAAPGVNVTTTTIPDPTENEPGLYFTDSGTSLSTPIVAGIAALVLAANPALTGAQVQKLLAATASGSKRRDQRVGAGVVDAARAVRAAQADE